MATVRWHLDELTGSTLTLRLYPLTSGSIANGAGGDAMTEAGDGLFSATVAESLTGWHKAYADRSGAPVASGFVNMSDASPVVNEAVIDVGEVEVDEAAIAAAVAAALSGFDVVVTSPISNRDGRLTIAAGDDYTDESGNAFSITITGTLPSLSGATFAITLRPKDYPDATPIVGTATLTSQVGETAVIKCEITRAQTALGRDYASTNWWYDLQTTLADGTVRTLKGPQAPCTVLLDQTQT